MDYAIALDITDQLFRIIAKYLYQYQILNYYFVFSHAIESDQRLLYFTSCDFKSKLTVLVGGS